MKVYGRDAYDTQLVATLWRNLWYRGAGTSLRLSRLQAAEHEGFATLLAQTSGLATRAVVTAASTIDDDALLVLRGEAVPFAALESAEIDDVRVRGAWAALAVLDRVRIAHQQIDPTTLAVVAGAVGLVDFGGASVAPTAVQLLTDRAQLLVTIASLVGDDRALRSAIEALGNEGVARPAAVPANGGFQPVSASPAESSRHRRRSLARPGRDDRAGSRRRSPSSSAGSRGGPPCSSRSSHLPPTRSSLPRAAWTGTRSGRRVAGLRPGDGSRSAFLVAQLPRLTQALTTIGSVPVSLPFGPVYTMQLAIGYMNVALPSNLGADGGQHPLLPAPGALRPDRCRSGRDRLVRRHGRPGHPARRAARVLRVDARPRPDPSRPEARAPWRGFSSRRDRVRPVPRARTARAEG